MMKKLLVAGVLLLLTAGCAPVKPDSSTDDDVVAIKAGLGGVYRVVDYDAHVVCYYYDGLYAGGLDCLPFSEVNVEALRGGE